MTLLIALAVVALGVVHWRLSRLPSPWYGALFPALALVAVGTRLASGELTTLSCIAAAVVLCCLVRMWVEGRRAMASEPSLSPGPAGRTAPLLR